MTQQLSLTQQMQARAQKVKDLNSEASKPMLPEDGDYLAAARPLVVQYDKEGNPTVRATFIIKSKVTGEPTSFAGMFSSIRLEPFKTYTPAGSSTVVPIGVKMVFQFFKTFQLHSGQNLFFDADAEDGTETAFDLMQLEEYIITYNKLVESQVCILPIRLKTKANTEKKTEYQNTSLLAPPKETEGLQLKAGDTLLYKGQPVSVIEVGPDTVSIKLADGSVKVESLTSTDLDLP